MNTQEQLALAIRIAVTAHEGQYDKGGKPYILHPLHLMSQLMYDPELAAIAVLHDVVEDSKWTMNDLVDNGFSDRVVNTVYKLTHQHGETYDEYIGYICDSIDAIIVKRKDLEHNSDITRLKGVTDKDLARMAKYHKAFIKLGKARDELRGLK